MGEFCRDPLWNWTLTWHNDNGPPDLTACFQLTVLGWIPPIFLVIFAPVDFYYARQHKGTPIPLSKSFATTKHVILTALIACQLQLLAHLWTQEEGAPYTSEIVTPILRIVAFIVAACLVHFNRVKGVASSGIQFFFWFLLAVCEAFAFRTNIIQRDAILTYPFILGLIFYPIVVGQLIIHAWADKILSNDTILYKKGIQEHKPCPQKSASFVSKLTFFWYEGLGWKGYKRPLTNADLWQLNEEDESKSWYPQFQNYWKKATDKTNKRSKSKKEEISILPTLFRIFGPRFAFSAFLKLIHDALVFVSPEILDLLIEHVASDEPSWKGYVYTVLLFGAAVLQTLILAQYFHQVFTIGMRLRSTLVSVIYRKALVMSNSARKGSTIGEIVNLMSVDAQRFMDMMPFLNMIWSGPFQIGVALYFLWNTLGPSTLAGVAVMILLIPINGFIVSKVRTLQVTQMKNKDERVKLMSEILNGIKVLKLYAWEPSFEAQVMQIRTKEYKVLKESAYLFAGVAFIFTCTPFLVSIVTFASYVLIDENNVLDARKAFVSTTLFNIIRMPMAMLPVVISGLVQTSVSLKRLNTFMNNEDIDPNAVQHQPNRENPITIQNGNFTWGSNEEETNNTSSNATEAGTDTTSKATPAPTPDAATLRNINMNINNGSLTAIVGAVGSGKSSLLAAILGEMEKTTPTSLINTSGSIAYVSQQAWIQNESLRNNILFGRHYSNTRYDTVIDACALTPDLAILSAGDRTEIGEKGINLSGGQKQRVSLARAAYADSDIYLLDDPLSAVDSHVGKHIFERVIGPQGMLQGKTRLLVTHGVTFLPQVDRIIVLKDGEISEQGSYAELLRKKGAFAEFLLQHLGAQLQEGEGQEETEDGSPTAVPEDVAAILKDLEDAIGPASPAVAALSRQFSRMSTEMGGASGGSTGRFSRQVSTMSSKHGSVRSRKSTSSSLRALESAAEEDNSKLIEIEKAETGSVDWSVYLYYFKSVGKLMAVFTIVLHILNQLFSVYSNIWLTQWANAGGDGSSNSTGLDDADRNMYLGVYGGLGVGQAASVLFGSLAIALGTLYASQALHLSMLQRILHSPMSFFDTTPTGRIVNRFSKDVDTCDNVLPSNLRSLLVTFLQVISTVAVISFATPIFMVVILPMGVVYYLIQRFYVATSRQLKRLESISRSPIYSHFNESLMGTMTIRAFGRQDDFIHASEAKVDFNQMAYFPSIVSNRWLAVRLETVGNLLILFSSLFAVLSSEDAGLAGLSISYALQITQTLNWMVRMSSDVETNVVAVERIKEYCEIGQEAEWESNDKHKPPNNWPDKGQVTFEKYATRYREGMDLVLKDVTCTIQPAEKIGIVGRTGAGKSSLTLGLFRIIEAARGHISIDGINLTSIGLHDVRRKITIIPQDPVLFSGSLRMNLDPFNEHSDTSLWSALEHAHLKSFVQSVPNGLDYIVTEGGENLSVGQRQLICLARALLRKTKILVLDEATAAIDLETDDLIQMTIRKEFSDCTVLTIAHRLNTIMDSTRVIVLDKGEISEFDKPKVLLADQRSIFYGMAKDAGLVGGIGEQQQKNSNNNNNAQED